MELFHNAKIVRLCSHHEKFLLADDDEESVVQDWSSLSKAARWTMELVKDANNIIHLKKAHLGGLDFFTWIFIFASVLFFFFYVCFKAFDQEFSIDIDYA